jgi:hypothetical protein
VILRDGRPPLAVQKASRECVSYRGPKLPAAVRGCLVAFEADSSGVHILSVTVRRHLAITVVSLGSAARPPVLALCHRTSGSAARHSRISDIVVFCVRSARQFCVCPQPWYDRLPQQATSARTHMWPKRRRKLGLKSVQQHGDHTHTPARPVAGDECHGQLAQPPHDPITRYPGLRPGAAARTVRSDRFGRNASVPSGTARRPHSDSPMGELS